MIFYNVTINIDSDVHDQWLQYMQKVHLPEVMQTGCFMRSYMSKIVIPANLENEGISYSIQYLCANMATLQQYQAQYAPALQQDHSQRYEGKFVAFRSVMEVQYTMAVPEISEN